MRRKIDSTSESMGSIFPISLECSSCQCWSILIHVKNTARTAGLGSGSLKELLLSSLLPGKKKESSESSLLERHQTMSEKSSAKRSRTDLNRLRKLKDKDIDFSDIPPLKKSFFAKAKLELPRPKPVVTLRLDADLLDWFKSQGPGYQTRINAVLRMYMKAAKR